METSTDSRKSIRVEGVAVPGAEDRQRKISGFCQETLTASRVVCVGAGGLMSHVAGTLVRKGIGSLVLLDDDVVEVSNLNRQRFYARDIGRNKAVALAQNLLPECIVRTEIVAYPIRFEQAVESGADLDCRVAVCGVDNNPARVAVARYFRARRVPAVFAAVSADGDHGYVFVQDKAGACIGCLFPDSVSDDRFPCPGTPAIADILQAVGALAVYAVDSCLMPRPRLWNYRRIYLSQGQFDSVQIVPARQGCALGVEH